MPIPLPEVTDETTATPPHGDALARPSAPVAAEAPAVPPSVAAKPTDAGVGVSGERLTRQEAFGLVARAVAALTTGDRAVPASRVREKAFELLGRDSESLSERNFIRILKDAHDGDAVDLRRRGDDYEVAVAAQAAPVAEQLNRAAAAMSPATRPAVAPPVARGMGPRDAGGRARGPIGRAGAEVPPDLLMLGVVEEAPPPALEVAPVAMTTDAGLAEASEPAPAAKRPRGGRKKAAAKKAAGKTSRPAPPTAAAPDAPAAASPLKSRRGRAKKKAAPATADA